MRRPPRRSLLLALGTLLLLSPGLPAAVIELEPGLRYLRIHSLTQSAGELRQALHPLTPLVLDLRYVRDEPEAATALNELNSQPAKPRLYVLVSPATPRPVADAIHRTATPLITLGVAGAQPAPQVEVAQPAEADRRAYAAADAGQPLSDLLSGKIADKERYDEASLMKEFSGGHLDAAPPPAPDPTAPAAPAAQSEKQPAPTDRVLQRAVHLHRALLALKAR